LTKSKKKRKKPKCHVSLPGWLGGGEKGSRWRRVEGRNYRSHLICGACRDLFHCGGFVLLKKAFYLKLVSVLSTVNDESYVM